MRHLRFQHGSTIIWQKVGEFSNGTFNLEADPALLRRRRDLQGMPLTVGFQTHEIISKIDRETGRFTGYYGDLVVELSRSLNFSLDLEPLNASTVSYGLLLVRKRNTPFAATIYTKLVTGA